MKTKNRSIFKKFRGTLIPSRDKSSRDIFLMTPNGQTIRLVKNAKFPRMRNLMWEPISVVGRFVKGKSKSTIDVSRFTCVEEPLNLADLDFDSEVRPDEFLTSIDYEAMSA